MTHPSTAAIPRPIPSGQGYRVHWHNFLAILLTHLGALLAPWTFSWSGLALAFGLYYVCLGWGISLCYHRLLTHRGFRVNRTFARFLTVLGALNSQGGPLWWVGTHRLHHRDPDSVEDPHTPRHGFNWAHVIWSLGFDKGTPDPRYAAGDLAKDPVMVFIDRWHWTFQIILSLVLFGAGAAIGGPFLGLSWVVWGVCLRTAFGFEVTGLVNSVGHTWGYRNYDTPDDSRNNWIVSLFTFGEGWHNNHHASQRSAAHGQRWWEFDVTYQTIRVLEKVGLVTRVIRAEPAITSQDRRAA